MVSALRDRLNKTKKKKEDKARLSHHLTTVFSFDFKMLFTFEAKVMSFRFVLVWGLFPTASAGGLLKPSEPRGRFMLPLMT